MQIYDAELAPLLASQQRDPLLRHLTTIVVGAARRHAPSSRVIDVGCGVGRTAIALAEAGFSAVGVDPNARAITLADSAARQHPTVSGRLTFCVGEATAAPPTEWREAFGLAVCSEVIEHVRWPERVVAYAFELLRPGGVLILTAPHDPSQWTAMDDYAGHVRRFTAAEVSALLAQFEVLDLATEGFPFQRSAMWAYDRLLRRSRRRHDFGQFGNTPPYRLYTSIMPYLLQIDHRLRGLMRGTTLVAVARKSPARF